MIDTLNVGSFIYNTLRADSKLAVGLNIGNRIYPIVAEDGTSTPFIIYRRTGLTSNNCKDGYYEDTVRVEIKAVSNTYAESVKVINRIRQILEQQHFDWNKMRVEEVEIENASENYEFNAYTQTINLVFKINE